MLYNLASRFRALNMMLMITENSYQVIDCNTDNEYEVETEEQVYKILTEFERHHDEVKRIVNAQ